jgi:hypothetical protein
MEVKLNLNDTVKFRLTKAGKKKLNENLHGTVSHTMYRTSDGYYQMNLWEVGEIFRSGFGDDLSPLIVDNELIVCDL